MLLCARVDAGTADSIAAKRARIEALHARLAQKRAQLQFEIHRASDFKNQLSETNTAMGLVQARVDQLRARIQSGRDEDAQLQQRLALAETALRRQRDAYAARLVHMYEDAPLHPLMVLVGSTSFVDLTERWDDLRYVVRADQHEIAARHLAVRQVDELRAALSASIERLQADEYQQAQDQSQLAALAQQRRSLVAMAEAHQVSVANDVQTLEDLTAAEEASLEALLREQQAELERERAHGHAAILTAPGNGQLQWPLSGPITSPYGMRLNPFGGGNTEYHPGIDIGVAVGTPVAAAAAGRVIVAGWVSGYGNYVAIDHGGGISTGYGHLSQIYVAVGQDVQGGQTIGASGNTGRSTGPHLIFEVRRNGTPVDPNPFLR